MTDRVAQLRSEILAFESLMDQAHDSLDKEIPTDTIKASRKIGRDWLDLAMFGKETLRLTQDEHDQLEKLFEDMLCGRLNDSGKERDLDKLIEFKLRFEKSSGVTSESAKSSWVKKLRRGFLIFLIVVIVIATYVYSRLINLVLN